MRRGGRRSDYTSLKSTGMRAVDETFKVATQPLRDAADLRSGVAEAEAGLTATCGLAPFANMKQCVRTLSTRVSNSAVDNASLRMYVRAEVSSMHDVRTTHARRTAERGPDNCLLT